MKQVGGVLQHFDWHLHKQFNAIANAFLTHFPFAAFRFKPQKAQYAAQLRGCGYNPPIHNYSLYCICVCTTHTLTHTQLLPLMNAAGRVGEVI